MSEQLLDGHEVCAVVEQRGGERVAQDVRADLGVESDGVDVLVD